MLHEREEAKKAVEQERIARAKLEGELEALKRQPAEPTTVKADYKDITELTAEEIAEWQATDPKGFAANMYAQVKSEALMKMQEDFRAEREAENKKVSIEKTYKEFEDKHKDFKPMWDSGEIVRFIEANPGHNPISAYHAMTYETRMQKAIEEARAKAIKETEEKVNKNWQAKKQARVLGAGPGGPGTDTEDKELKNVKSQGGLYSVLAQRLDRLRAAH
jgi:anaerobic selenocysteine-containing dehydrogenase